MTIYLVIWSAVILYKDEVAQSISPSLDQGRFYLLLGVFGILLVYAGSGIYPFYLFSIATLGIVVHASCRKQSVRARTSNAFRDIFSAFKR